MMKVKNDRDAKLQAVPIEKRCNIDYAAPKNFVQYSRDKRIIEKLINAIKAKPTSKIKNNDIIQISNHTESFLKASRICYASSKFYTNDFQWVQDSLSGICAFKGIKNRLLLSSELSPLTNMNRYTEAKRQLEEVEAGMSETDSEGFASIGVAFLESSMVINGEYDSYFNDLRKFESANQAYISSQYKARPSTNGIEVCEKLIDLHQEKKRKKLMSFKRDTNLGLELIQELTKKYNVEYLDELKTSNAWGVVVSGKFTSNVIESISENKANPIITLTDGTKLAKQDFSDKYRRRFKVVE